MKKNLICILSFVASMLSFIIILVWPSEDTVILAYTLTIIFGMIGIVLGFIGKKKIKLSNEKGKGLAIAAIIIGIILTIICLFGILGIYAMKDINNNDRILCPMENDTKDCIDNGDGTSTCRYMDIFNIPCSTDKLKDTQFKK